MIRYKIKNVSFECDEKAGTVNVAVGEIVTRYTNAVEAWNVFTSKAFYPLEKHLRDKLEENGFNRWTGTRRADYTESELKVIDEAIENGRKRARYDI